MYPLKNQKRWFFGFNMKLSVYLDYTRKISKFPPWGRVEREGDCLQTFWTFSKKISNIVSKIEIFFEKVQKVCKKPSSHSTLPHGGNLEIFLVWSIHVLNFMFKPKKHRFWFFNGYMKDHFLSLAMLIHYFDMQVCMFIC